VTAPRDAFGLTQSFQLGARPPRKSMRTAKEPGETDAEAHRSRRAFARLVSFFLEPLWYWADLFGPDDHPSNTKVVATLAILAGLVAVLVLAISFAIRKVPPDLEYYGFATVIIGGAAGWDTVKTRMKTRAAVDVITAGAGPAAPPEGGAAQ
jgi:hypothetical protein